VPLTAALLALVLLGTWLFSGAAPRTAGEGLGSPPTTTLPLTTTVTTTVTTSTTPAPTTTTGPGSLPQTDAFPPAGTPQLSGEMAALWHGIVIDSVTAAMPAFFPEQAYIQLKAISNAASDYQDRLVGEFALDIGAAHALLGPDPRSATLVAVNVPEQYGHWIPPGTCTNAIGYFEVANSRIVYQENGVTRSFGIASLISWRGVWYVVHLGAILRTSSTGVVEDPTTGPGYSTPSTTC